MKKNIIFLTIVAIISCFSTITMADLGGNSLPYSSIANEIKSFVTAKLTEQYPGNIVTELLQPNILKQLHSCSIPLDFNLINNTIISNRTTIKISCNGDTPWAAYLPIAIKIFQPVITTTKPMSRNELITADSIRLKELDIIALNQGFFADPDLVIGQILRFPMKAGTIITPHSITKNKLVKRGDKLNISVEDSEVMINMQGESLEDGGLGDNIKVRNNSSKRIIEATIIAPGKVQVSL